MLGAKNLLKGLKGDGSNKQLHIKLVRAENLKPTDKGTTADPFVEFTLGGVTKVSKKEKGLNPVWNEDISPFVSFLENDNLAITVNDNNVIEKAKFMGKVTVPLRMLPKGYTITKRLKLQNVTGKTSYITVELQAVNFGTNARLFEVNQHLKSYVRAFHSESDPLKNAIILRQTGQIYTDLAKCVKDLKKLENNNDNRMGTVDPLIIVFPGQYLIRRTIEVDMDNLVIYGISSREEEVVFNPIGPSQKNPMLRFLQPGDKIYRDKMIADYMKKNYANLSENSKEYEDTAHNIRESASIKLFDQSVGVTEKHFHLHNIKFAEGAFALQIYRNCTVTGNNVEFTKNKDQARGGVLIQNLNFEFDELEQTDDDDDDVDIQE